MMAPVRHRCFRYLLTCFFGKREANPGQRKEIKQEAVAMCRQMQYDE